MEHREEATPAEPEHVLIGRIRGVICKVVIDARTNGYKIVMDDQWIAKFAAHVQQLNEGLNNPKRRLSYIDPNLPPEAVMKELEGVLETASERHVFDNFPVKL